MIIAIDGTAASGKGTLAKRLADHFDLPHLDTGTLYRAVGVKVLRSGKDPADPGAAIAAAESLAAADRDHKDLRTHQAGMAASRVSAIPAVREALITLQRTFAHQPGGAVLDGRDIGTVICPGADAKFFVTASPEVRAARRSKELAANGEAVSMAELLAEINARDHRDMNRATAPLKPAPDSVRLDTTDLTVEAMVMTALSALRQKGFER